MNEEQKFIEEMDKHDTEVMTERKLDVLNRFMVLYDDSPEFVGSSTFLWSFRSAFEERIMSLEGQSPIYFLDRKLVIPFLVNHYRKKLHESELGRIETGKSSKLGLNVNKAYYVMQKFIRTGKL